MTRSLENKINRRAALAGLAAGVLSLYGCSKPDPVLQKREQDIKDYKQMVENRYTYDEFKEALGDRYLPEKETVMQEFWREGNDYEKQSVAKLYGDYDSVLETFSKKDQEALKTFNAGEALKDSKKLQKLQNELPWKFIKDANGNYSREDTAFLYFMNQL